MLADNDANSSENPFASPSAAVDVRPWKESDFTIAENRILGGKEIWLPFMCVKCGEKLNEHDETALRKTKKLSWVHPAVILLVFLNMLIFLIVALIVKKQCSVTYSLCQNCRAKRQKLWLVLAGVVLSVVGIIAGMIYLGLEPAWPILTSVFGFIAVLVLAYFLNGPLVIAWYSKETFRLKGAGKTFLERAEFIQPEGDLPAAILAQDGRTG